MNIKHSDHYNILLLDPRWKMKRKVILERDNNKCVICKSTKSLNVHHRQYHYSKILKNFKNPWEYDDCLLITLCDICHKKGHELYNVPIKYV